MMADKCLPMLGRQALMPTMVQVLWYVLAYGTGRHPRAKFEHQFLGKALFTCNGWSQAMWRSAGSGYTAGDSLLSEGTFGSLRVVPIRVW